MIEEDAEKVASPAATLAVMVTGPVTFPLFKMTATLPLASVVPEDSCQRRPAHSGWAERLSCGASARSAMP
jgi:hypothetical protein